MAITITAKSKDFTKVEEYLMTIAPNIISLKDLEDETSIPVDGWLEYTEEKDGKEVEIMSIITPDRVVYGFQSATAKRALLDIDSIMEGNKYSVIKISGTTKAGRPYVNLTLDTSKL